MIGTVVNASAILACSAVGLVVGRKIPKRLQELLIRSSGLICIGIGIKMFLDGKQILVVLLGLMIGAATGEALTIERKLEALGTRLQSLIKTKSPTFLDGFVNASLLYCVGPMAVLGSIADGVSGQHEVLFIKSLMDGVTSIALAASLGIGVLFSGLSVLLYQGAITLVAQYMGDIFTPAMISDLTAVGGLLIVSIGLNLLGVFEANKKIPLGNLLPAIFFAPFLGWLCQRFLLLPS